MHDNILYVSLEDSIPYQKIGKFFGIFDINSGLVNNKKTINEGLQQFKDKILDYDRKNNEIKEQIDLIKENSKMFSDRSLIMEYQTEISKIPFNEYKNVNSLINLKNILPTDDETQELKNRITKLSDVHLFIKDYKEYSPE